MAEVRSVLADIVSAYMEAASEPRIHACKKISENQIIESQ